MNDKPRGPKPTDDLIETHDWSEASAEVASWFDAPGPWVIEGVAVPRALRKWLAAHPEGKPCDVVHWLEQPRVVRTLKQDAMASACRTVMGELIAPLLSRGVKLQLPESGFSFHFAKKKARNP